MIVDGDTPSVRVSVHLLSTASGIHDPAIPFESTDQFISSQVLDLVPNIFRELHDADAGVANTTRWLTRDWDEFRFRVLVADVIPIGIGSPCFISETR